MPEPVNWYCVERNMERFKYGLHEGLSLEIGSFLTTAEPLDSVRPDVKSQLRSTPVRNKADQNEKLHHPR